MKTRFKLVGLIAFAVVMAFSFTACGEPAEVISTAKLTIKDLPSGTTVQSVKLYKSASEALLDQNSISGVGEVPKNYYFVVITDSKTDSRVYTDGQDAENMGFNGQIKSAISTAKGKVTAAEVAEKNAKTALDALPSNASTQEKNSLTNALGTARQNIASSKKELADAEAKLTIPSVNLNADLSVSFNKFGVHPTL